MIVKNQRIISETQQGAAEFNHLHDKDNHSYKPANIGNSLLCPATYLFMNGYD